VNIDTSEKPTPVIRLQNVSRQFAMPAGAASALSAIDLHIAPGEGVAIVGRSGSGKTTLLNLLTGIDRPSSGTIEVAGRVLDAMSEDELAIWRRRSVGIVFQFFHLLPTLTVLENVLLPMDLATFGRSTERRSRAHDLLDQLGIADQAHKLPADLSGGQQQRAAIARALANDPPLIVADEPTGNLDTATADDVIRLLASLPRQGKTVVIVSHERDISKYFTRIVALQDGSIARNSSPITR
jgi:putative ABC transport system ATP-binding protein